MSVFNRGTNIIIQADPGIYIRQGIAAAEAAEASAAATAADALATAADRVATGEDRVAVAAIEARTLRDVATLLANTSIVYGAGAAQVAAGDIMQTRAEGFSYEVAAEAATDQHVTTAGGVKLYVLPGEDGWINFTATGAISGGLDHSDQWDAAVAAGRKIFIPAGTWRFNYRAIPADTKVRGVKGLTVLRPTTSGIRAILTANAASASARIEGIELDGLRFVDDVVSEGGQADNLAFGQIHLLTLNGVRRCVVRDCEFIGFRGDGIYLGSGDTTGAERHNEEVTVSGCWFDGINNTNRNGLSVIDCDGLDVSGCVFENCSYPFAPGAIDLEPNDVWSIIRNINVHHNRFRNVQSSCFAVITPLDGATMNQDPYSIQFTDNHAEDCDDGFSVISVVSPTASTYDSGVEFRGNKIVNSRRPFFLRGGRGIVVENNEFLGSTRPAELAFDTTSVVGAKVRGNIFYQCASDNTFGRAAIIISNVDDLSIEGNDFIDCGRADGSTGFCLEFISGFAGTKIRIERNQFLAPTGRTTRAIRTSGYTLTASGNVDDGNIYGFTTVYEFTAPGSRHLTAAPSAGTWAVGNVVYNSAPANGIYAWVCTAAGTPGAWAIIPTQATEVVVVNTGFSGTLSHTATDETQIYSGTLTGATTGDIITVAFNGNPLACSFRGAIVAANTLRIYGINMSGADASFTNAQFNVAWTRVP